MTLTDQRPPEYDEPPFDPYEARTARRTDDRTPPQDHQAEQAVLGAMLTDTQAITDANALVAGPDFYQPAHEQIYDVILALHTRGEAVDYITVAAELGRRKIGNRDGLTAVGGITYVHDLVLATPITANAGQYATIVRDAARLRAFVDVGTRLTTLGYSADVTRVDAYLSEALQTLDDAVQRFGPRDGLLSGGTGLHDLAWVLDGAEPRQPPPEFVRRTDGTALFYAGKVNGVFGDPEHGKTWLAQCAIVEALAAGGTAAMIDVDHNGPSHTAARLLLLGARLEHIADPNRFRYYEPHEGPELLAAVDDITLRAPSVTVIDSLGEIFPMLGVGTNDGDEITTAMRQVCTRPAVAGSCVITIDHLPKSNETRATGFAIGSIAKKRMIRGSYIRADAKAKPTPGRIGRIVLRIEKDTSGELRRASGGTYAGELVLDSTDDHVLRWEVRKHEMPKNDDGSPRFTTLMETVAKYITDHPGCTGREISADIPGKDTYVRNALTTLVNEGFIRREPGKNRAFNHYTEIPYREAEDDHANPPE